MHVPDGWKRKEFSEIAELGKTKFNPKDSKIIFPCVELENIEQIIGRINGTTDSNTVSSIKNVFKKGDVLFGKLRPYLKKYFYCNFDGICSTEIWVLRTKKGCINSYLFNLVQTHEFICAAMVSSGSKMPRADWSYVAEFPILLPPEPEQQKIAKILSIWDKAIEILEALIAAKQKRKKALIQQLLTSKKRFAGFDGEWKTYVLSDLGNTFNGLTGKDKNDFGFGKPYIPYMNIFKNNRIDTSYLELVNIDESDNQCKVKYGDIFFTTSSETPDEVGMSSVLLNKVDEVYLNSFCFGFRLEKFYILHPEFARYLFRAEHIRKLISILAQGATRYNLSKTQLLKIKLQLPCIEEQQKIASVLSSADKEIETHQKQLSALKEQKKGLMQQLLTGKNRVKIDLKEVA
jgi:type I restriction enzyme S subunit